ncbi:chorismate mutase [Streptomyces sp. NPDC057245]|uniref:chorismate mutase n=1 Tax=Streptomyces TaxID=1883 RepID=UPI001C1DD091|nr:chorismate mutase [Streptomyces sp. A108]MBU6531881.1 chorismate mutase [Streptomyces sp. A108]
MARATDSLAESLHAHIAELDADIIELVRRRSELGAELVTCRRAAGRPAVELARENDVLQRYGAALGRPGTALAMILTELGRRRPPARGPEPAPARRPQTTAAATDADRPRTG